MSSSNIIFFKNIDISEYDIETIFTNRILNGMSMDNNVADLYSEKAFDKIPNTFSCLDEWPKKTNLLCWTCHRRFDGIPTFMPSEMNIVNENTIFKTKGNFCNFSCVMSFIDKNYIHDKEKHWKYTNMTHILYAIFNNGKSTTYIPRSMSPYETKPYGGHITTDEYTKQKNNINTRKQNIFTI